MSTTLINILGTKPLGVLAVLTCRAGQRISDEARQWAWV